MEYDIVVVGAGPAGSTAAKTLAEQGLSILLIDKEKFPRDKPCGGGLPLRVLKRFPYIKDINVIESYSYGGYVYSPSLRYKVEMHKQEPVIAMVLRKKFDNALVELAIDSGARFQDGKTVIDFKIKLDNARVTLNDGTHIDSDLVIGADGFLSTVARKAGLFTPHKYIGISVVEEFPLGKEIMDQFYTDERSCYIHMKFHGLVGYGWVFPKQNHVNIGLGEYRLRGEIAKSKKNLKKIYNDYLSFLKNTKIIPRDITSKHLCGGALLVKPLKKTFADHVILCGDAAGFVNPISGEGMHYALVSGEIAAEVAKESIQNNDTSGQFLSRYEQLWKKDFGRDIKLMLKSSKRGPKQNEKLIRLAHKDEKLGEMLLDVMTGQASIFELRWKILKRYLYASIKHPLKSK